MAAEAETKPKGPLPDYKLGALDRDSGRRSEVGAGWSNPDGSISIRLNYCVTIRDSKDLILTLFPNTFKGRANVQQAASG